MHPDLLETNPGKVFCDYQSNQIITEILETVGTYDPRDTTPVRSPIASARETIRPGF